MKRVWIILSSAVVIGLVLAVALVARKQATAGFSSWDAPTLRVGYPRGQQFTYRWSHQASTEAQVGPSDKIAGALHFDGKLVLRGYGEIGDGSLVGVSMAKLARHQLSVLGRDLLADDATAQQVFDGREAFAEITAAGAVKAVRFRPQDPALFKNVMLSVLLPMAMNLRQGSHEWSLPERTAVGVAATNYARSDDSSLTRTRLKYESFNGIKSCDGCVQQVSGDDAIELDPAGWLKSIGGQEDLKVAKPDGTPVLDATLKVSLRLEEVTSFQLKPVDAGALQVARLGETLDDPGVEERLLASRIRGLTVEQMLGTLSAVTARGAQPPEGFVSRASALLIQHPEYCANLVTLFGAESTTSRTKALLLDVLASASTPQAQKAMREALSSEAATKDPNYLMLLQRFSFVTRPDSETAAFMAEQYEQARQDGKPDLEFASAHTLGSVVGELNRTDPEQAQRYDAQLREDLASATSTQDKKALLAALGNAHSAEDMRVAQHFASSSEPELRAQAAFSLRSATSPAARQTLISLVVDPEPSVQAASLRALAGQPFSEEEAARFSSLVTSGQTPIGLDHDLLSFLGAKATAGTDVRPMVQYIAQRTTDVRVRARANFILEQLGELTSR